MAYDKDPTEKKDYGVDWSRHLAVGETISTSTWTIAPVGLSKTTPEGKDSTTTWVRLTSGTAGQEYAATNHVVTSTGQEFERTLRINVTDL